MRRNVPCVWLRLIVSVLCMAVAWVAMNVSDFVAWCYWGMSVGTALSVPLTMWWFKTR